MKQMHKILVAGIIAIFLFSFFSVLGNTPLGDAVLSHQPESARFTACKSALKNAEVINQQRQEAGLEPIGES